MSDKYGFGQDAYCYPGTDVLINLLGITDNATLAAAEVEFTQFRLERFIYPVFRDFSLATWKNIHFYLFQDVYEWAGELRTVKISKLNTLFAVPDCIEREAERLFWNLKNEGFLKGLPHHEFVSRLAYYFGELNVIHPFREGNGRAQRLLFELLAINAGFGLNWQAINKALWIPANIAAYQGQIKPLADLFNNVAQEIR